MKRKQRYRNSAFTLIEVLIVISVIGVLVGLLLPAVQSARERARATSCKNNLMNLHLAIANYQVAFKVFPAGTVTERLPARMFPDGKDHSWLVQVRPFMEGGFAFSEQWSPVHSVYHPRNWSLCRMGPPLLACPSSPFMHQSNVVPLSYVGIHDGAAAPIDHRSRGFFAANRFLRRREIADGLSNTLQLGEIRVNPSDTFFWVAGNQSTLRTTGLPMDSKPSQWGRSDDRLSYAYGLFADPPTISYSKLIEQITAAGYSDRDAIVTAISDLAMIEMEAREGGKFSSPPVDPPGPAPPGFTIPQIEPAASRCRSLGSTHGPMINAVFADGRVVTIDQAIDHQIYAQIGIRNDSLPLERPLVEVE